MSHDPEPGRLERGPSDAADGAGRAARSPRLREPKHHRIVHPSARFRRRAITTAGAMLIMASLLGFYTAAGVFAVAGSTHLSTLPGEPVKVAGRVTDGNGTEIVGAHVDIVGTANSNTTNGDGWYYLEPVPPGNYTVEASLAGYGTVRKTIDVSSGIPRTVDFKLTAGGDPVNFPPETAGSYVDPTALNYGFASAVLLCSLVAALGGWMALQHRRYLFAIVGAAAGCLTIGPFILGTLLAVAALAILASLKHGFIEADSHSIPWEDRSPPNRRSRMRSR